MVKSLVEVERGGLLTDNGERKIGNVTADSKHVYIFEDEDSNAKSSVYTASLPIEIGVNHVHVTPLLKGEELQVQGVCHVDLVGQVVLLRARSTSEPRGTSQVLLRVAGSESQDFECNLVGKQHCLYLPFARKNGGLMIACHSEAILVQFQLHRLTDSSFRLSETRRLRLGDEPLRSFSYNTVSDFALAVYSKTADILILGDTKVVRRATIEIANRKNYFGSSAVSSHPIFFIANVTRSQAAVIQLFDVHGRALRRSENRPVFDTMVNASCDFVVCEDDTLELRLLYCASHTQRWHYIRLRCEQESFEQVATTLISNADTTPIQKNSQVKTQECSCEKLCEFKFLPDVSNCCIATHNESAFFILDRQSNSVKRLPKDSSLYSASCLPSMVNRKIITSVYVLDRNSLIVLLANCIIVHVCVSSMQVLRSVRFRKDCLQLRDASAYLNVTQACRMFVAIFGHDCIQQVRRTDSLTTDWRLVKSHKFPNGWIVIHVNFDAHSRRFALVLGESIDFGSQKRRVSLLNDELNETQVLSLPYKRGKVSKVFLMRDKCLILANKPKDFYLFDVNSNCMLSFVNGEDVLDILSFQFLDGDTMSTLQLIAANQEAVYKSTFSFSSLI